MARKGQDPSSIYQLKVTLLGIRPPIWRRIQVRANTTLPHLHETIQVAMSWAGGHLHQFTFAGVAYGVPDPDLGEEVRAETRVKLGQVLTTEKERFLYTYDFGDNWNHMVQLDTILPAEPEAT